MKNENKAKQNPNRGIIVQLAFAPNYIDGPALQKTTELIKTQSFRLLEQAWQSKLIIEAAAQHPFLNGIPTEIELITYYNSEN